MYEFGAAEIEAASRVMTGQALFRYMDEAHEVDLFEAEYATAFGVEHALATSSGTAAIICGLAALGVGPGDEVVIPAYGYVADVLAILAVGAVPVVCEIDDSLTLDPSDAARKITSNTKVIMPVHMSGLACDLDPIMALAQERDIFVLEDACQAIGGTYKGRRLGTFGHAGAFSFNQAKIITAGEGGLLLTRDQATHDRAFIMHDPSSFYDGRRFGVPIFGGLGFRMNEVSGAILRVQLSRLDSILERLRRRRDELADALGGFPQLARVPERDPAGSCGSFLAYTLPDNEAAKTLRAALIGTKAYGMATNEWGHSFFEWDLLHQRRGAHHPARNPLAGHPVQGIDACPVSFDILGRSIVIGYGLDLDPAAIEEIRAAVARELG